MDKSRISNMKNKKKNNKTSLVQHKIVADDNYPFYKVYHDESENGYIISHDCRSKIAVKEKKMQYNLDNPSNKETVVYKIDDGIIKGPEWKCDFGIYTEENVLFLIELKNPERGYEHALEQIINTIELLIKANKISVKELNARIVVKNYPEIPSSRERMLEVKLRKHYKCNLQYDNRTLTETI